MKKILFIALLTCFTFYAQAVHILGGAITWRCDGNGSYIFQYRVYIDCFQFNFAPLTEVIDVQGHPSITTIPVSLIDTTEVTPINCGFTCSGPASTNSVNEYVYESASINLGSIAPPLGGWVFYKVNCCWGFSSNLYLNGSTYSQVVHSVMYAYNNQAANPCNNSSPVPAEIPVFNVCASTLKVEHSLMYEDVDGDSLAYSIQSILDGSNPPFLNVNYVGAYSASNPLPGSPVLNSATGMLSFQPANPTVGVFNMSYKVDEYRCGVKIASVYHPHTYRLVNNCAPIFGGGINNTPALRDPLTNGGISILTDTIFPGDSVVLSVKIDDVDLNPSPISPQTVSVSGSGDYSIYGVRDSGCTDPPCAWFSRALPYTFQAFDIVKFNWKTDCSVLTQGTACGNGYRRIQYNLHVSDNFCPTPGIVDLPIVIVVRMPYITVDADTLFYNGPAGNLQWYNDTVPIVGATNNSFLPVISGSYSVHVVSGNGCSLQTAPRIVNLTCNFNPTVSGTTMLCPNDTGSITTQVYDSYQWYKRPIGGIAQMIPGATSQSLSINYFDDAGYYFSVEATDSGCAEMSPEVLVDGWVFLLPTVSSTGDFTIGTNGETIVCDGDTMYFTLLPPYDTNITWYESGNPIPGATSTVLTVTDAGFYTVQGAPSVCPNFIQNLGLTLEVQVITCGVGVDEISTSDILIVNPSQDNIRILSHGKSGNYSLELYDTNSRLVLSTSGIFNSDLRIPIPDFTNGIYFCVIKDDKGQAFTRRIVINKR